MQRKTIRILVALALENGWEMSQVDVFGAYLNSTLTEDVFMEQPPEFFELDGREYVCRLGKSINGLKQSGKNWYDHFRAIMESLGFEVWVLEPGVFFKDGIIVGTYRYVDLSCIGGVEEVDEFKVALAKCVEMKDLGEAIYTN